MTLINLPLAAASSASLAVCDLLQIAHEGGVDGCRSLDEDTIPTLADALKMAIEYAATVGDEPGDVEGRELLNQLAGALARFLEGWA